MAPKVTREIKRKPRLFLDSKLKRAVEALGWDFGKLVRAYDAEPSRRGRGTRIPPRSQIEAVERFLKSGDFDALKKALGTETMQTANAAVARVMAYKARKDADAR